MASANLQPSAAPAASSRARVLATDSTARFVLLSLLLAIATAAVYAPVHTHPFSTLDDYKYIVQNAYIRAGLTPSVAFWSLTHGYAGNWHPLTWMSHALDIQLFGMDPAGHHDENVFFHALDVVLLFWVLRRATGYTGRSLMVAALFALHPLNVESVAWVAERKTLLSTMFFLLALGAYRWYASQPRLSRYALVTVLFGMGLMCKPQIIMFPLVLLLWDYWPLRRLRFGAQGKALDLEEAMPTESLWRLVREKLPLFFIALVDAAVTMLAHLAGQGQQFPLWSRIENVIISYVFYIEKTFWPVDLALYYRQVSAWVHGWQVAAALLLLLTITALALYTRQRRYLMVGWLWYVITLFPMTGIVQVDVQGMADRYAYISCMGLFLMIVWGVADWAAERHLPKPLLPAVSVVVLVALALTTYHQIGYWRDDVALWSHSVEVVPNNWRGESSLGAALEAAGRPEDAIQHYFRATAINPREPFANRAIAIYEHKRGNFAMAIEYYKKVLPEAWSTEDQAMVLRSMAGAYQALGDSANAEQCLARIDRLPKRAVNWQGAWWKQIMPLIRQYFHGGSKPNE